MSAPEKDGGPAFPQEATERYDSIYGVKVKDQLGAPGMTLRQYYKAAALTYAGELTIEMAKNGRTSEDSPGQVAYFAAEVADAMLAEDEAHAKKQPHSLP